MKWFLAKLVFQIICGSGNHTPQFDEQLRLIYAEDELHAFYKARLMGDEAFVDTVENAKEKMENLVNVNWKFIDVTELHLLNCDADGAEIYSVIREQPDANLYISSTKKMASQLLQLGLHQFTGLNNISSGT